MKVYRSPDKIDCDEQCEVPIDIELTEIPRPRHAWPDVLVCPNCGRAFLLTPIKVMEEPR